MLILALKNLIDFEMIYLVLHIFTEVNCGPGKPCALNLYKSFMILVQNKPFSLLMGVRRNFLRRKGAKLLGFSNPEKKLIVTQSTKKTPKTELFIPEKASSPLANLWPLGTPLLIIS